MKKSLTKAAAAITLAGALAFGAPVAASANGNNGNNGNGYPPNTSVQGPPTIAPGAAGTFLFAGGTFVPGERVNFRLSGVGASNAGLASIVHAAVETKSHTKDAAADGSTSVVVTLHPEATGVYTLEVFSDTATLQPISISAVAPQAGTGAADGSTESDGSALPNTGTDSALMLGLWVGGGALLLAGGAIVVGSTVRRQRQNAA